jgi:Ca2+-binding EF-hand superfamily protein
MFSPFSLSFSHSTMKVNDDLTKRRLYIASLFKSFDNLASGNIKLSFFQQLFAKLTETGYLNPKKHKIKEVLNYADPYHKGKVEMNRFMDWIDIVSTLILILFEISLIFLFLL